MNIAIIGYGGMGRQIVQIAKSRAYPIVAIVDPQAAEATHTLLTPDILSEADVAIDFTLPHTVLDNISMYLSSATPAVIGTTGWYDSIEQVQGLVQKQSGTLLWSSNFSIGVNLYFKLIAHAASLFNRFSDYDVWGLELHHHNKADSPSGTAHTLSKLLLDGIERKQTVVYEKLDRKPARDEIHFASVRGGATNFEHVIGFDSEADCIKVSHAARNRSGYAAGAIHGAEWLVAQKPGLYSFDDFMEAILQGDSK